MWSSGNLIECIAIPMQALARFALDGVIIGRNIAQWTILDEAMWRILLDLSSNIFSDWCLDSMTKCLPSKNDCQRLLL